MKDSKKLVNLISLVVLVATNILSPLSYATAGEEDIVNEDNATTYLAGQDEWEIQNDGWEINDNPGSESMTDQQWNNEHDENEVESGLSGEDGWETNDNPESESMTDQQWNNEQDENEVESGLSGEETTQNDEQESSDLEDMPKMWGDKATPIDILDMQTLDFEKNGELQVQDIDTSNITYGDTLYTVSTPLKWNWWDTMNNFTYGTITIPRAWHDDIIIMDRNLGADSRWDITKADWNYGDYPRQSSYWYQYQRWNNYGFSPAITPTTSDTQVTRGVADGYSNSTFITANPWNSDASTSDVWTQWPCPAWWHVPSSNEWNNVHTALNAWGDGKWMAEALLLPPAGRRNYNNTYFNNVGSVGNYWSSTPLNADNAYYLSFHSGWLNPQENDGRAYGFAVRCFRNFPITITFNLNGWYWTESWTAYTQPRQITYNPDEDWNYISWSLTNWKTPSKEPTWTTGWMFDGWYLGSGDRWTWNMTRNMTVYAHWLPFEDWTIPGTDYVIMDRNLWATAAWTTCSNSDLSTCGYHFQWWNNYGFKPCTSNGCTKFPNGEASSRIKATDVSWVAPSTYYGPTFIYGDSNYKWNADENLNLRWWQWDTTTAEWDATSDADRQWPCPWGYHVPSTKEWKSIYDALWLTSSADWVNQLKTKLNLPFAGFRLYNYALVLNVGSNGIYWSSTPSDAYYAYHLEFYSSYIDPQHNSYRADGFSVRCLKDSPIYTLTFNATKNGGQTSATSVTKKSGSTVNFSANTATKSDGYSFVWWNTDSDATTAWATSITLTADTDMYAIFSKNVSATFLPNNNKLDGGTADVTKNCTKYNNDATCDITTPVITNDLTTTAVGYTTSSSSVDTASIASDSSLAIEWWETYYAQTKKAYEEKKAVFLKWQAAQIWWGNDDTIVLTCTPTTLYNGVGTDDDTCTVVAPSITVSDSYKNAKWNNQYNGWTTLTLTAPITYYIAWSENNVYTINYVMNGWTNDSHNPWTYIWWNNIVITDPTKTNATFLWWTYDGQDTPVKNLTLSSAEWNYVLVANWLENDYSIRYNWVEGSNNASVNPTSFSITDYPTIWVITKDGYTFAGWTNNAGTNLWTSFTIANPWDKEYTAHWTPINYSISYTLNGWTNNADNPTTYNAETFVQLKNPTKNWYTFAGWSPNSIIPTWTIGNKTFTANWTANKYQISYDLAGWILNGTNPSVYTYWVGVSSFTAPSKRWYTFAGWKDGNDDTVTSISTTDMWDKTLTATWTANSVEYYVYYYAWETMLWVEIKTADAGTTPTLAPDNYKAFEWYTKPTESTTCPEIEEWKICKVEGYTKTSYSLTFKNGDTVVKTTSIAYDEEIPSTAIPAEPTKEGYTFNGWDKAIPERMPAKDVVLNAKWSNKQYKITYTNTKWVEHANAWSYNYWDAITFAVLSKEGYTFNGWTPSGILATDTGDKTVNASWTAEEYTISFQWVTKTAIDYTIETDTFTIWALADKEGYIFEWWTGDGYTVPVKEIKIQKGSMWDKEFTANWSPINYTITYVLNGGTNGNNPSSYTIESDTITLVNPSKEGYTFAGWKDGNNQTVTTIPSWSHENITLTATWNDAESYTITYNGVEWADNTMNPSSYTVNDLVVLKNPSKEWYTFAWWEEGNIIEKGSTGNKTFTATWTPIEYTITYQLGGGTNNANNPSTYTIEDTVVLQAPTNEGKVFRGWRFADSENVYSTLVINHTTWNKTVVAVWWDDSYTITYKLDGWVNSDENPNSYIHGTAVTLHNPTKRGYNFVAWKLGNETVTTIPADATGDKELTATWSVENYTINYELNGGLQPTPANPSSYTVESEDIVLKNPSKEGYTFKWWTEGSKIENGSIGNKTFTANWEAISYPITYVLNGGINNANNPSSYTIESAKITLQNPTKKWYTFKKWTEGNTIENGSIGAKTFTAEWEAQEVEYYVYYYAWETILWVEIKTADAGTTPTLAPGNYKAFEWYTKPTESTTCPEIEEWKICKVEGYTKTSYSLTFKNGDTVVKTTSIAYDEEIPSTAIPAEPTKEGYTFNGWDKAIPERMPAKDVVLNAKWSNKQYKITYTNTKWVEHANAWSYNYWDAITFAVLSKEGYTFNGWTPSGILATDTGDKTVNASWTAEEYTISFQWIQLDPITYTIESWAFNLPIPSDLDDLKFIWWTGEGYPVPSLYINIAAWSMWNKEFTANWWPKEWWGEWRDDISNYYTVLFLPWDHWTLSWVSLYNVKKWLSLSEVDWYSEPEKIPANWYTFGGWDKAIDSTSKLTSNMVYIAQWKQNSSWGWSSSWGWGRSSWWWGGWKKMPTTDTHGSAIDKDTQDSTNKDTEDVKDSLEDKKWEEKTDLNTDNIDNDSKWGVTDNGAWQSSDSSSQWQGSSSSSSVSYTQEQVEAYTFAKANGITTKSSIEEAKMNTTLTRIQMAKMLSNFAINVLWEAPDTSKSINFKDVSSKKDKEYDNWVTLAYQLWIMWQNMKNNEFRPNDEVTRAEFATALSRLLYNTDEWKYKWTRKYYVSHMAKLYNEWIINVRDPSLVEKRWYVMIMLKRSVQ